MTITITEKQSNFAFGNNKAPKNAKGSKTNYGTETSSVNNTYLKSNFLNCNLSISKKISLGTLPNKKSHFKIK